MNANRNCQSLTNQAIFRIIEAALQATPPETTPPVTTPPVTPNRSPTTIDLEHHPVPPIGPSYLAPYLRIPVHPARNALYTLAPPIDHLATVPRTLAPPIDRPALHNAVNTVHRRTVAPPTSTVAHPIAAQAPPLRRIPPAQTYLRPISRYLRRGTRL